MPELTDSNILFLIGYFQLFLINYPSCQGQTTGQSFCIFILCKTTFEKLKSWQVQPGLE